eukprot:gene9074-10042_t
MANDIEHICPARVAPCNDDTETSTPQQKTNFQGKIRHWYATLLARHPWVAFLLTFLMIIIAATSGFIQVLGAKPLPDFSSPSKGFEARGTLISKRILSYNNLHANMHGIDRLPTSTYLPSATTTQKRHQKDNTTCSFNPYSYLSSKTIYKSINGDDLMSAERLKQVCKMEKSIVRDEPRFDEECVRDSPSNSCCPSLSLGHYVAVYNKKASCFNITQNDVNNLRKLMQKYKGMYDKGNLTRGCEPHFQSPVAIDCKDRSMVNYIFMFMVDKEFIKESQKLGKLTYTVAFSSIIPSKTFLKDMYMNKFRNKVLPEEAGIVLAAYDFENMKTTAYDTQLINDVWYIMLAVFLILCLMWAYSGSLFISVMGFSSVGFAIILSYWIYTVIFGLSFFPFLNIMTAIFVVGIGADDIFVYVLAWRHARQGSTKRNPDVETIIKWTEYALLHATAAMFVTSFTTATAFYAGLSSSITALQCFAVFAGTSILTNYFLMITWLPAVMVVQERFFAPLICQKVTSNQIHIHPGTSVISQEELKRKREGRFRTFLSQTRNTIKRLSDVVFRDWIGKTVVKLRYCWLALLLILAVFGMLSLTFHPKLSLPTTQSSPLFIEDHSIEQYDSTVKGKLQIDKTLSTSGLAFPVILVWGVSAVDNGYFLDPDSTGSTVWDNSFDLTSEQSQLKMLELCQDVKSQKFYDKLRNAETWCFLDDFNSYLQQPCTNGSFTSQICCNKNIPLSGLQFKQCTKEYVKWKELQSINLPIKLDTDGAVKALVFKFNSNHDYQLKFSPAEQFWEQVKAWADRRLSQLPTGTHKGWVISNLYFYDLQKSIADGTVKTIAVSIGISAIVLLVTTQNIIITFYAVIAITAIISVTIGSLVAAGWQLNILESMTMSVAVGLSIDFTLHYGVAYFSCEDSQSRKDRVHYSLWHVGSAVAMGTVTTFLAGLVMMPSVIYAYIQIGHFLMLIMSTSWVYSTFFFLALCAILGPQGHVGNVIHCWKLTPLKKSKVADADAVTETLQAHLKKEDYLLIALNEIMLEFIFGREMVHAVNVSDESKDVPGDMKYLAWRFINMIMAACFSFAAFVQINDPDSLVWILLYALPALICLTIVFHPLIQRKWHLKLVCIIHSIICGFGIIYSLKNGYDEILTNNSNIFAVEEAREAGGLAIVLSWLLMIAFIDSKR